ncbi:hypothetical protein [Flavobacterium sp. '19STA2R22 D10 B1']|uniref:hypothetical protein n=1 Tax=Flavobacterium aerium TaxID=3037261 RepID=UPI00278BEE5A|nr:hypothetical protein [Flavobacterium sp. '19STA2R22 D10 B1']
MIVNCKYYGLILLLSVCFACTKPKPNLESVLHDKSTSQRLIIYTDSIAHALTFTKYTEDSLLAMTNRFAKYLPLQVYHENQSQSDSLFLVGVNLTFDTQQSDMITITIPRFYSSQLRFKEFTDYFGPAQLKDSIFLKTKMPTPEIISLVGHFNQNKVAPDLLISNTSNPNFEGNKIYYLMLLKKK